MKFARIAVLAAIGGVALTMSACQDSGPIQPRTAAATAPSTDLLGTTTTLLSKTASGLVSCKKLPGASVTVTIGSGGGTITVGPHALAIPKNALTQSVAITATVVSDDVNRVHFEPHGLTFRKAATLTMSYANCGIVSGTLPGHIAYVDGGLNILELLDGVTNARSQTVSAGIEHFSDYAIAW